MKFLLVLHLFIQHMVLESCYPAAEEAAVKLAVDGYSDNLVIIGSTCARAL